MKRRETKTIVQLEKPELRLVQSGPRLFQQSHFAWALLDVT